MRVQLLLIILVWTIVSPVESVQTVREINKLTKKLLQDYNKNTLPSSDFNKQFIVDIVAHPLYIGNVDNVDEKMSTVLALTMTWNDTSIQWNPDDHSNITNITLGLNEVWKPKLTLLNPHPDYIQRHSDASSTGTSVTHYGQTTWVTMVTLHTFCILDTKYFPFDVQHCMVNFFIAGNDVYNIIINASWKKRPRFSNENGVWKITRDNIYGSKVSSLNIGFRLERKPMFMMLNVLLPICILALLTPLVFIMPKSSSERLSFSVNMLLAISVYMTIVSDHLPKNSDPMPRISIVLFCWYLLNAVIVLIVILNIKISLIKDNRSIPGWVCAFVRRTRTITCNKTLSNMGSEEENETITWMDVSVAIDKWCFVIVYLIKFVLIPAFVLL